MDQLTYVLKRLFARRTQALADVVRQRLGTGRKARGHAQAETVVQGIGVLLAVVGVHGRIPLARSALASAWTAREQCVLTLPSEHPMTAAVSATSISSQ